MSNVQDEIRAKVDAFAAELTLLVRAAALDAVRASLGETIAAAAPAAAAPKAAPAAARSRARAPSRSRARAKKAAPAAKPAAAPAAAAARPAAGPARKKGQKRDPGDLARLVERLFDYIKANPGQRIEHIKAALGVPTSELTLPIRKLTAAKRITSKGEKRATTYSPR